MKKTCVPSNYKRKTMAVFALVLIAFLVQLSGVNGCSCVSTDPQTKYCNSEYAVRGKVTKLTYGDGFIGVDAERIYEVEISKVYIGNINEEKGGTVQIRTAGSGSMCGVGLRLNKEYLINGYFYKGQMRISLCGMMFFSPVDGTNANFPTISDEDCKCKIENILVPVGVQKPKMVCGVGNRVRCSSDSGSPGDLAECKYSSDKDDCDWDC
ncbi:metalloproteinase inhibitor 3-like isoform X3 [Saccostrea cucullata]|uniref:metalloproteinase inhibitor 3-like isoform X3 n=1 Tax=Saccostrea cuccullata TaxID=36930 RepID=UPI002ED31E92